MRRRKFYNLMASRGIHKRLFSFLKKTPLHPQWFIFKAEPKKLKKLSELISGYVLDIGCSEQKVRAYLPPNCNYIGLDYYQTARDWYHTTPDVYGDAQKLPLKSECIDCVLLLDVLEHLPDPSACLRGINYIGTTGCTVIIDVPFVYPIHDAPLDYSRWSIYGLKKLISDHGFLVTDEYHYGDPLETAAVLANVAIAKTSLNWISRKNPAAVLVLITPLLVTTINMLSFIFSAISPSDKFMPLGYRLVLRKK